MRENQKGCGNNDSCPEPADKEVAIRHRGQEKFVQNDNMIENFIRLLQLPRTRGQSHLPDPPRMLADRRGLPRTFRGRVPSVQSKKIFSIETPLLCFYLIYFRCSVNYFLRISILVWLFSCLSSCAAMMAASEAYKPLGLSHTTAENNSCFSKFKSKKIKK